MRTILAVYLGKLLLKITRSLKIGGGSALPGLYALKIDKNLVSNLIKDIPRNIVITGTNGKTTTSGMLSHIAREQGKRVVHNWTGSNLERGIASVLISQADILGRVKNFDLGIWELDEAAFNNLAPKIKPEAIVFLNVFRDQLDRYGEIDAVVGKWQQTLSVLSKNTQVILNGDDLNLSLIKKSFSGPTTAFGVRENKIQGENNPRTKDGLKLNIQAQEIEVKSLDQSVFTVSDSKIEHRVTLPLPGLYNIYNFLGAFTAAEILGLQHDKAIESITGFASAFGRVEKIRLQDKDGYIFLIKNPVGTTQVFSAVKENFAIGDSLLIALNDNLADGTDVSWIWDIELEKFKIENLKLKIFCSGTRAYDLALRLKYTGLEPKELVVLPDLKTALEGAVKAAKGRLFILPTYTALLSLQKILASKGLKKHYWREV